MKAFILPLISLMALFIIRTECKGSYDCDGDDCSFFDFPDDPRDRYMYLWLQVESNLNRTLSIPSWKKGLMFYDGYLSINVNEFADECTCPIILKEDKSFVMFHSRDMLDLWYSYKFPFSDNKDGALQITCEYTFRALLMNQTNHSPIFQEVEVTSLYIFNLNSYGVPLEWIGKLPGKYVKFIEKALHIPVKKLLEDTLLQAFNGELKKLHGGNFTSLSDHGNSVH